jgi:tRNA1Val (adenine37-N6)-methyltransferase
MTVKSGRSFRFKQFEIGHDRCGMKVGTDGVLLGAWVRPSNALRILDVGTGSGLIALILAQRSDAQIVGIEYDASAAGQALENAQASPWADRVRIVQGDFKCLEDDPYDLIVSNPPFFQNALKAPAVQRNHARHDVLLRYDELIAKADELLTENGRLSVIIPCEAFAGFETLCLASRLHLSRICEVSTIEGKPPKRLLLEFSRVPTEVERSRLAVSTTGNARSEAYSALTADLYL